MMTLAERIDYEAYGIGFELQEADFYNERTIRPNRAGILLLAFWRVLMIETYWHVRQHYCKHENMVDESYGGPDFGCMAGSCPDCGFAYHHTLY